ncbi:DUF5017 domain-containing protein [Sphingobacterium spiritivorum]|uniref:DUF5017 domain-containing protein n=1 Tax=Sphingobacterium spiritivorum TaxID=258 RepID=UPI0019195796|nr:DUF5017 domain-containing protein [Sphingobacterium spiritivorum]QQT28149.1 DUF5017 domain-containing protein [Sphingobacterium spiritivorum]
MRSYKTLLALPALFLFMSCEKNISPEPIRFDVEMFTNSGTKATQFKVNDTLNFKFTGNPDRITFYSGEVGSMYANRERTSDPSPDNTLRFFTNRGTAGSGGLKLLLSTDNMLYTQFNNKDSLSIPAANWKDISDRVTWANGASNIQSGDISLNTETTTGSGTVWLAFKYTAPAGVAQSTWTVGNIDLRHKSGSTIYTILTSAIVVPTTFPTFTVSPGWGSVNVSNSLIKWAYNGGSAGDPKIGQSLSSNTGTQSFVIRGNTNAATALESESWIVTGPIDLKRVLPDVGLSVKNKTENAEIVSKGFYASPKANFTYKFTTPGTYEMVFFSQNDTGFGQNSITKTIKVDIIP